MKKNVKQLSFEALNQLITSMGVKPYRTRQIHSWVFHKAAVSFDDMTDLPSKLRADLNRIAYISSINLIKRVRSKDGSQKLLFELEDSEKIESVLMPNAKGKLTLCISSQAGCALGCSFCMTGRVGFRRNLKAHEIFDQVISARRYLSTGNKNHSQVITNIVLMGMGEPMNNIAQVIKALEVITGPLGISRRKVTVSTAGIPRGIAELAAKGPDVNLAVSLNATTDKVRSMIMPINKKHPLKQLIKSCRAYPLSPHRRITFEYIMIRGLNDTPEDARRLQNLLQGIRSKVNLIPYNASSLKERLINNGVNLKAPSSKQVEAFQRLLTASGISASIRKSMGSDISAACGQLMADYESRHEGKSQ